MNLQNTGNPVTEFTVITGKLRTIAARTTSGQQQYLVNTPTAVCGVRGTDFTVDVAKGKKNALIVKSGLVEYINTATGQSLSLGAGMLADTFAATFQAIKLTAEQLAEALSDMDFTALDPAAVPGYETEAAAETTKETTEETPVATAPVLPTAPEETGAAQEPEKAKEPSFLDPIMEKLKDLLGMEIGSVTIEGETWAKALIQPTFAIGKLKMSLYLPIIYKDNMFDPTDWYHPKGNDEWSFGTDKEGWMDITADVISDLFLKIRYIEWGEQRDKFFFKVGNLNDMTIGHGLLMDDYANDADFPSVRKVALNFGLDFKKFGFELMANDLASGLGYPDIFGGRIYFRPAPDVFRFAIGVTGIVDLFPAHLLAGTTDEETATLISNTGDPILINASVDFDFPIIENDILSIVFFGDVGGMIPYFRETVAGTDISGFYTAALFTGDTASPVRNYGIAAGVFGNILIIDYRLEYRNFNGTFKPSFFNNRYDRLRGEYAQELAAYVADSDNAVYDNVVQGIYGEAGFSLLKEQLKLEIGYMAPFYLKAVTDETLLDEIWNSDTLHIEFVMEEGTIPSFDIHGSISLDRTGFVGAFIQAKNGDEPLLALLFDENTVVRGELIYPVAETLDIAGVITTTAGYDAEGVFGVTPSISIETRLHF